jgi:hypothetical protein
VLQAVAELIATTEQLKTSGSPVQESIRNTIWLMDHLERIDQKQDPVLFQTLLIALRGCAQSVLSRDEAAQREWLSNTGPRRGLAQRNPKDGPLESVSSQAWVRALVSTKTLVADEAAIDFLEKEAGAFGDNHVKKNHVWEQALESLFERVTGEQAERVLELIHRTSSDKKQLALKYIELSEKAPSRKLTEPFARRSLQLAESLAHGLDCTHSQTRRSSNVEFRNSQDFERTAVG